jgi:cleavage and polyadenylation specificity factor subunit 1
LIYAFNQKLNKCSPKQFRHLDYIGQFTTEIKHIPGQENLTAHFMSRIEQINMNKLNYEEIVKAQEKDPKLKKLLEGITNLKLNRIAFSESITSLICDTLTGVIRPYIPLTYRKQVFNIIYGLSHPGVRATTKLIRTNLCGQISTKMYHTGQKAASLANNPKLQDMSLQHQQYSHRLQNVFETYTLI